MNSEVLRGAWVYYKKAIDGISHAPTLHLLGKPESLPALSS
jgi:hypothetical protein